MLASKLLPNASRFANQLEKQSLANVLIEDGDQLEILGQAWLSGKNTLVTCAHVVEGYLSFPQMLSVRFPYLGQSYVVQKIELHPRFGRLPDRLIKFDLALLTVESIPPELKPLPFCFNRRITKQQKLVAVRYPVHLGDFSDQMEPVAQEGHLLANLHRQDNIHILHDLALSPGDSGTPIFDRNLVAAIHCGDTATLPGLNLPATAIRLAISIDALQDLGVPETAGLIQSGKLPFALSLLATFFASLVLTMVIVMALRLLPDEEKWLLSQPTIMPVDITFNQPLMAYKLNQRVQIDIQPRSDCHLYLFDTDEHKNVYSLFPLPGFSAFVRAGQKRSIGQFGETYLTCGKSKEKLLLVALISSDPLVKDAYWSKVNPAASPLSINSDGLMGRIHDFERLEPDSIWHVEMDAPRAL